jgi:hypothetical protein
MTDTTVIEYEDTQIVPRNELYLGTMVASGPEEVLSIASKIATTLKDVIDTRKLYIKIHGKAYVQVEGWTTLGALLGVLPRELSVEEQDGDIVATVELIRASDQQVVGRGSAMVGMDEPTWQKRPAYARRSMAVTRATGKAYRLAFSWIMNLAGYEVTPAEEMMGVNSGQSSDVLRDRFDKLWKECKDEGIPVKELTAVSPDASDAEIKAAGKANKLVLDAVTGAA